MILNRLTNPLRQLNYKYVIGEVILIFLGISLSLYFDEWRTDRAERKKEKELLTLMMTSIKRDTTNLDNLSMHYSDLSYKFNFLLDTTKNEDKLSEKSVNTFGYLLYHYPFLPDLSAYENIKQEGLTIIKDQEIRIQLIRYNEKMVEQKMWTESIINNNFKNIGSYVNENFDDFNSVKSGGPKMARGIPNDFKNLKKDKAFWKLIKGTSHICYITSEQMKGRKASGADLLNMISENINK